MKIGAVGAMALLLLVAFAGTATVGCPPPPPPCVENANPILWAGQNIDVGHIMIWHDGDYLYVRYMLDEGTNGCDWYLYETNLAVALDCDGIPHNKNPQIGKFEYSEPPGTDAINQLYTIALEDIEDALGTDFEWGDTIHIAAHAVVIKVCNGEVVQEETGWGDGEKHWKNWAMCISYKPCEYKVPVIPTGSISYSVSHTAYPNGDSYFATTINSGGVGNAGNGDYLGWCIDLDHTIGGTNDGTLSMPSPGDDDFCKWNKINWILNNKPSDDWEVIQAAIWNIWIGTEITASMGTGLSLSSAQIIAAEDLAEDASTKCWFRAFSGDWVAVIVTPVGSKQITIIEVDP